MIQRPDMIVIGSTERNVGKTELACELIRRQAAHAPVTAVKITTIKTHDRACSRGGDGCGACSGFDGPFHISDEIDSPPGKDTTRMRRAGAATVLWLRACADHMREGVAALLSQIPPGTPVVCESNSVRHVLAPGLFLVIARQGSDAIKPSCAEVIGAADRVLRFHGQGWDLSPEAVSFVGGRWLLRREAAAIVLAGGQSRRMGADKSLLPIGGEPMIARIVRQLTPLFDRVLIGANDPAKYAFLELPVIADEIPGQGPLMALASCLAASERDLNFVTACDIPDLDVGFLLAMLRQAEGYDVVLPVSKGGRCEPLFALYRRSAAEAARDALERGERRMTAILPRTRVRYVDFAGADWYRNLNTPGDYRAVTEDAFPKTRNVAGVSA